VPGVTRITSARLLAFGDRAGAITRLPLAAAPYYWVRASRDGSQLAIATDDGKEAIVWIYQLGATTALRRLTIEGRNLFPVWSPDGERVAFQSNRERDLGIFSQRVDGASAAERLTQTVQGEVHVPESWSPDGKHLSFAVVKEARHSLWTVSLETRKATPLSVQSEEPLGSVFSPDGRWIAYATSPRAGGGASPNRGVYVQPFPPTGSIYQAPRQTLDFHPVWMPKSLELVFTPAAATGRLAAVTIATRPAFAFSSPTTFPATVTAERTSNQMRAHDVLPDGRFVGLVSESETGASSAVTSEFRVILNWFEELKQRAPNR
jgi:Tol biopolymer transport system component